VSFSCRYPRTPDRMESPDLAPLAGVASRRRSIAFLKVLGLDLLTLVAPAVLVVHRMRLRRRGPAVVRHSDASPGSSRSYPQARFTNARILEVPCPMIPTRAAVSPLQSGVLRVIPRDRATAKNDHLRGVSR